MQGALSATQPPTAILYQLYLESGAAINVADFYSAFCAIIEESVEDEDCMKWVSTEPVLFLDANDGQSSFPALLS